MAKPGDVIGEHLPEAIGQGKRYERPEFDKALDVANRFPGQWVFAFYDTGKNAGRSWIKRRHPTLLVSQRKRKEGYDYYIKVED